MNQVFLEERSKEKVNDALNEGRMSQDYYRNRPDHPNQILRLVRGVATILGAIIHLLFSKKKQRASSHEPS